MAKPLINIFPNLKEKMIEKKHDVNKLVTLLGISDDSVRRRLKGEKDFELSEIIILADEYGISITKLFERI